MYKITDDNKKFIEDTNTGLLVPISMVTSAQGKSRVTHPMDGNNGYVRASGVAKLNPSGLHLQQDEATGIPYWPSYASGLDDLIMRGVVGGWMANTGVSTVPVSLLSTIVAKRQAMVSAWNYSVVGKNTPAQKALDVLRLAEDGMGAGTFSSHYVGGLDVDNAGVFISQIPIHLGVNYLAQLGFTLVPIDTGNRLPVLYYLDFTQKTFRANRGLWTVDRMLCYPTGVPQNPYWVNHVHPEDGRAIWVLTHNSYATQRVQHIGGKNNQYPGFGQSGTWRFSPYIIERMLIKRGDMERMIHQPPRGIVMATGLDYSGQLKEQLADFKDEREETDMLIYPGVLFAGYEREVANIKIIPWSEPPNGYSPDVWHDEMVATLAACFFMSEAHLRIRVGGTSLSASAVTSALESDTALANLRQELEWVSNWAFTGSNVSISVHWPSDYQEQKRAERAYAVSRAMLNFSRMLRDGTPETTIINRAEARVMLRNYLGIPIEDIADDSDLESITTNSGGATADDDTNEEVNTEVVEKTEDTANSTGSVRTPTDER